MGLLCKECGRPTSRSHETLCNPCRVSRTLKDRVVQCEICGRDLVFGNRPIRSTCGVCEAKVTDDVRAIVAFELLRAQIEAHNVRSPSPYAFRASYLHNF